MLRTGHNQEAEEEPAQVECYAGHAYPGRPRAFTWQGRRYEVAEVVREWQEPGCRVFAVADAEGRRFTLRYYTQKDLWTLQSQGAVESVPKATPALDSGSLPM